MENNRLTKTLIAVAISHTLCQTTNAALIDVGPSCTLVEAIFNAENDIAANGCTAGNGDDTIQLPANSSHDLNAPYADAGNLHSGTPEITTKITILGRGSNLTRLDGGDPFLPFRVQSGGELSVIDATVSGGNLPPDFSSDEIGGACFVVESGSKLNLTNVTVSNCIERRAPSVFSSEGGVTLSDSELLIQDSTISENSENTGIYAVSSNVTLLESSIVSNQRGLLADNSTLFIVDTLFEENGKENTVSARGGIRLQNGTIAKIDSSTISRNRAYNYGGGIYAKDSNLLITNSLISYNKAQNPQLGAFGGGGGLFLKGGSTALQNSTISKNIVYHGQFNADLGYPAAPGGAITFTSINSSYAELTITNSTIVLNVSNGPGADALALETSNGKVTIRNSIIGVPEPEFRPYSYGSPLCQATTVLSVGRDSIIEDGSCETNALAVEPRIGPLQDNGGKTKTHSLLSGSPAIDIGLASLCNTSPISGRDQRRFKHLGRCDAGSFEFGAVGSKKLDGTVVPPLFLLLDEE